MEVASQPAVIPLNLDNQLLMRNDHLCARLQENPVIDFRGWDAQEAYNEGLEALACYPSHMEGAAVISLSPGSRVEVQFEKPFPPGRNRINCTLPGPDGRWYWFGRLFMVAGRDAEDLR